jgi:uncharacterized protein (TIGR02118 family)
MIKLVYCITRRRDLSREDFLKYWREVHGPIGARIPGVKRLVQSHAIEIGGDTRRGDFDGMAELWFESVEALLSARHSEEWRNSTADEANFIDHSRVAYFVSEEHDVTARKR